MQKVEGLHLVTPAGRTTLLAFTWSAPQCVAQKQSTLQQRVGNWTSDKHHWRSDPGCPTAPGSPGPTTMAEPNHPADPLTQRCHRTTSTTEDKRKEHECCSSAPTSPTAVHHAAARSCRRHPSRTSRSELWSTRLALQGSGSSAPCHSPARPDGTAAPPDPATTTTERSRCCTLTSSSSRAPCPRQRRVATMPHRGTIAMAAEHPHRPCHRTIPGESSTVAFLGSAHEILTACFRQQQGGGEVRRGRAGWS
jgi:hypothetical protein